MLRPSKRLRPCLRAASGQDWTDPFGQTQGMLFEHSRIFFVCLSVTHLRIDSQNMAIIQQPQNNQAHSPVSRAAKCGFPLSSTHALAIIVSRHERFCRFSINVIVLEEIDPLIFLSVIATFVTHFLLSIRSRIPSPSVLNKNPPCL